MLGTVADARWQLSRTAAEAPFRPRPGRAQGTGGVGSDSAGSDGVGSAGVDGRMFWPSTPGAGAGVEVGAMRPPPDEVGGSSSTSGGSSSTSSPRFPPPVRLVLPAGPACACGFVAWLPGCAPGLVSPLGEGLGLDGPSAGRCGPPPWNEGKSKSTASHSVTATAAAAPTARIRRHMPTVLL